MYGSCSLHDDVIIAALAPLHRDYRLGCLPHRPSLAFTRQMHARPEPRGAALPAGAAAVRQRHGMLAIEQLTESDGLPLPADVWGVIARATLQAEGGDVHAWERLSRVNSTWRAGLEGDCRAITTQS